MITQNRLSCITKQTKCGRQPGNAATEAGVEKCWKYNNLLNNYCFETVAIEITGVYGNSTAPYL